MNKINWANKATPPIIQGIKNDDEKLDC